MIAVVLACEVKAEPPVQVYLEEFQCAKADYKIICWASRSDSPLHQNPPGCIEFKFKKRDGSLKSKLINYFRFRRFLIKELRKMKPEKILFIPTQAGVLLPKRFFRRHSGQYYFDYRDPGYENHRFYLNRVMNMVKHSFTTAISSPGFLRVLRPSDKYVICNNVYAFETRGSRSNSRRATRIITSIGTLRTPKFVINEISPFVCDSRFEVRLYGTADDRTQKALDEFLKNNHVTNVVYKGVFRDDELPQIISESDALLVYYPSELDGMYHMPDRLYLGLQYGKPMVGNLETFCGQFLVKNGLGVSLNPHSDDLDALYQFLSRANLDKISMNSRKCLKKAERENALWKESIRRFIQS